jgi:hypothetical protein
MLTMAMLHKMWPSGITMMWPLKRAIPDYYGSLCPKTCVSTSQGKQKVNSKCFKKNLDISQIVPVLNRTTKEFQANIDNLEIHTII